MNVRTTHYLTICVVVAISVLTALPLSAQPSGIGRAAWLAGCWEARSANRVVIEIWSPPNGDMMIGANQTNSAGVTRAFEHLRLRARGDTLVYTAIPSGQTETDFPSTYVSADSMVFENPAHDFPQKLVYRRLDAERIEARAEGPGSGGRTRVFGLTMRRVDCAGATPSSAAPTPP